MNLSLEEEIQWDVMPHTWIFKLEYNSISYKSNGQYSLNCSQKGQYSSILVSRYIKKMKLNQVDSLPCLFCK